MNKIFTKNIKVRDSVLNLLLETSNKIILPKYKSLKDTDIKTKSNSNDLVTIADELAEQFLSNRLKKIIDNSLVIGEEAVFKDESILNKLNDNKPIWIIDPIDGTSNFVSGDDKFYIIIALVINNVTIMGWIHNPINSSTIWSSRGEGTWLDDNRLKIISKDKNLNNNKAAIYHKSLIDQKHKFDYIRYNGSAAHEYVSLVKNQIQISCFSRLLPWDHAAGILIHQEAGGYSALLDNSKYKPNCDRKNGILSAPNLEIWESVRSLMSL